jgi:hypothetical protein
VKTAYAEIDLWRPFLERFPRWESKFVHSTFWPSTVFTADAARSLIELRDRDTQLRAILRTTKIWATEEVVLPTLVALLGFRVAANPCSYDFVKWRTTYAVPQIDTAMAQENAFWAHPIPRRHEDPLRKHIRKRFHDYAEPAAPSAVQLARYPAVPSQLILARMRAIEGWLEEVEAELLLAVTAHALSSLCKACAVVEVGSYCGRGTVVLGGVAKAVRPDVHIWSVDPHDGKIGSSERYITMGPSFGKLQANLAAAGLAGIVKIVRASAASVQWNEPIALLLIDGLHDYASVSRDFHHFAPHLVDGGNVAFHDYGSYFPGVAVFVDELLTLGAYHKVDAAGSLIVLQKSMPGGDAGEWSPHELHQESCAR